MCVFRINGERRVVAVEAVDTLLDACDEYGDDVELVAYVEAE